MKIWGYTYKKWQRAQMFFSVAVTSNTPIFFFIYSVATLKMALGIFLLQNKKPNLFQF